MKASLSRWGNSLAIRLPRDELAIVGLKEGSALDVVLGQNAVIISKASETKSQFVAALWACKEAGLDQESLWDGGIRGSEEV